MEPRNNASRPERRKEPRLPADLAVTLIVLAPEGGLPIAGRVADLSGSGLSLHLPAAVPYGSPVKIEGNDLLLLGEVCRCEAAAGQWRVAVQVRHFLDGLVELNRLMRALDHSTPIDSVQPAADRC